MFGNTTITFELSIVEPNLDKAWYSLNGGLNYTFSGSSGTIEQEAWDACGNGTVTIRFYANNSAGNTAFKEAIIRKDIISPIWDFLPENQIIEFGDDLVYNVFALDSSGIHHWWINNSYDFIISNDGSITNALNLILGEYWLEIRAYDPCGNFCSASIKIIVQEVANPLQIPGYNLILLLGFIFTVVIYIYFKQGKARTSRNYIF